MPPLSRSPPKSSERLRRFMAGAFDTLTVRLALGIALLVFLPLGLGFYAFSSHHYDQMVAGQMRAGELQGRVLEVALRHQMMEQDLSLMASILGEVGDEPDVRGAMILNHEGEIRVASDPALVGEVLPRTSPSCMVCHSKEPHARERWIVLDEGGEPVLRNVQPIENRPQCHACHAPDQRLNGILIVDTSLAGVRAQLDRDTLAFVVGTSVMGVLLLGGIGFFVRLLILARLRRLGDTARAIASGDLQERARVEGRDVITALAKDFNHMAGTVSALVEDVRHQEQQLVSIMDSLDDGLVVLDTSSRIVAANRSFCKRLGSRPRELNGELCHDGVGHALPCCTSSGDCPAERCMSDGKVQRAVFQSVHEDGRVGTVEEVHASPVYGEDGRVVQVVEIWRDITERVEEERRLAEIEHLVALGTLASGFSHEVNTPLASMLTCAESALGRIDDCSGGAQAMEETLSGVRECAEVVRDQVLRCRRITEQFLRFSRGIPPSTEPVDLQEVVAGVVALVQGTAREKEVRVELERNGSLPAVRANTEVVQHAVLNLLVNAIQSFDGEGGRVLLDFDFDEMVRIRVRDEGCGIPVEGRAHLFEPFYSRKSGGTGLGLYLSRSFIRRFGGDVRLLYSEVGEGSCFEIALARTEDGSP